jgi:hypothetical protein
VQRIGGLRRRAIAKWIAAWLIVLILVPFTAPFPTYHLGGPARAHSSDAQVKEKAGSDDHPLLVSAVVTSVLAFDSQATAGQMFPRPLDRQPGRHAVLRL